MFPRRSIPHALSIGAILPLVATLAACGTSNAQHEGMPPPPAVSVAEVLVREVHAFDEFTGHIEAVESVELRPRVAGYIERVDYVEGEEVKKGDLLFTIDPRPYRALLARAEAELARTLTRVDLTRSELARAEKLGAAHVISAEELEQRRAALASAQAEVSAARAAVEMARLDLEFTEVRAPIDGRAGRALVTAGNLVTTQPMATVLTTIVSLNPVYVSFEGDEAAYLRYADRSRNGERLSSRGDPIPVQVALSNDEGFVHMGEVDFIDNRIDAGSGTIRARAVLDNSERRFLPGLFARVRLLGGDVRHALLVDDKAVLTDQDRKFVYVLDAEQRAMRRDVRLGRMHEGLRIVEAGLEAGDRAIVHGVQKVFFPGMPVDAQTIAMGDPPAAGGFAATH
ncbi:MAG TPA: efflux RND transporter periplasmic adaptor subunit [Xanthomonadaceae bacterium]|nr:efflux RND transporter periplasmic adaptor subunit [Xanthomonadaceae bacterium]